MTGLYLLAALGWPVVAGWGRRNLNAEGKRPAAFARQELLFAGVVVGRAGGGGQIFSTQQNFLKIFSRRFPSGCGRAAGTAGASRRTKFHEKANDMAIAC